MEFILCLFPLQIEYAGQRLTLKRMLLKAGFICLPAKGSHSKWIHPQLVKAIVLAGKDGNDAKPYQEKQVELALKQLKKQEGEEE